MSKPRPTIAYFTNSLTPELINITIWSGIYKASLEEGLNVICFPGNAPNSPFGFASQANAVFNLVSRKNIDGIIFWGGGLFGHADPEDVKKFYKRFDEFPKLNISMVMKGIHSIIIDNYQGMFDACVHLIEHHHCSRIAFIRGPEIHQEAEARFKGYKDALVKYGLPFDQSLILPGNFLKESGYSGIKTLLDERKIKFDAVAAASDLMVIGAMAELQSRGIKVPEKIKIVGFDDLIESQYLKIPLTSVSQPFFEMGIISIKHILSLIRHENLEDITILQPKLIIRHSCGCLNQETDKYTVPQPYNIADKKADSLLSGKDKISDMIYVELENLPSGHKNDKKAVDNILDALITELTEGSENKFIPVLNNELRLCEKDSVNNFYFLLSILQSFILPYVSKDIKLVVQFESLLHQGFIAVGDYAKRLVEYESFEKAAQDDILQDINRNLSTAFNIEELMNVVARELPRLGIKSCFLSLYENPAESLEKSRLILAYTAKKRIQLEKDGISFLSKEIIPENIFPDNKFAFIIEPLYFKYEQLGFAVFEERMKDIPVYEMLRSQLSVAIKGALLFQEKENLVINLENHTRELQNALEKLSLSNKELEQFSYIASHDLKEPLRKISSFAGRLKYKYQDSLDDNGRDYLNKMENAALRMQKQIDDLLEYSRLTTNPDFFTAVKLNQVIQNILNDIEVLVEQKKAVIETSNLPVIDAEPTQMYQLFQNLIINSIKFQKPNQQPIIKIYHKISSLYEREYCEITIEDNGIGIEEEYFDRIFILFQRLHGREYEGNGIGLAVCQTIINRHQGKIKVESTLGKGSKFIVTLPVKQIRE